MGESLCVPPLGGSTGGNVSFSGGVQTDGKNNNGVKAGVTIRY